VEYDEHTSPSIFVKFPMISDLAALDPVFEGKQVSVVIWTTTPWTLPANLAIALHPDFALCGGGNGGKRGHDSGRRASGWRAWRISASIPMKF
jgi:hypothetical protein